ncbi:MAG: hypothetical protein ABI488_14230, partial [Polyangiaceae bacterium]
MTAAELTADSDPPTLELHALGVRRAGSALLVGLSLSSSAARIGLIGDWSGLFQALTGQAELAAGTARAFGCAWQHALARGSVGFAPCDGALPLSFTITEYLRHAARLSHGSAARAARDTQQALETYGLAPFARHKLAQLVTYQRRALGIACAALGAPPVVCLETPVRGLDGEAADYIVRLCGVAAQHSRVIVSSGVPSCPSAERSLLEGCEALFWLERGALLSQGSPAHVLAPGLRYSLTVKGAQVAAFSAALTEAGCRLRERNGPGSYWVELPESGSTDLL